MTARVRILANELRVGMYVVEIDRPWEETPFLFQGFIVNSRSDIEAVKDYCRYVIIDTKLGRAPRKAKSHENNADVKLEAPKGFFGLFKKTPADTAEETHTFEAEVSQAKKTYKKSSTLVRSLFDDIRLGIGFNAEAIKQQVGDCVDSILRNQDAMAWVARMKDKSVDISTHCLDVCILSISFGKFLTLPRAELENLGLCAILHDVGLLKIEDKILFKSSSLSGEEEAQFRRHPELGRNLLMSVKDLYFGVIDVAYTHHEQVNGSGYPRGISTNQISPFAKIIAICDCYDSMLTAHNFKKKSTPFGALKQLNQEKDKSYDGQLVSKFIDFIGIFPIGSIVELDNHEVGIVITLDRKHPTKPKVLILLDNKKNPCKEKVINLLNQGQHKIVRVLHPDDYEIDINELKRRGLQLKLA